jgi:hypothetical protein
MVIIGGRGQYSAAGVHTWRHGAILGGRGHTGTWRQGAILVGRGPYSAAVGYTRQQEAMLRRSKKV